jgi:hypothetical protein
MVGPIQRVITAMHNATDPTAALMTQLMALGSEAPGVGAAMMTMRGGLEAASAAGESLTASLSELPLVTIKDDAGKVVAEFANLNGQLIPTSGGFDTLGGAAGGAGVALSQEFAAAVTHVTTILGGLKERLTTMFTGTANMIKIDADINPAAGKLQTLVRTITSIQGMVKVNADIIPAGNQLAVLVRTITSVAGMVKINADTRAATTAVSKLASQITSQLTKASSTATSRIATISKPFPGIASAATNAANKMGSAFISAASKAISAVNRLRSTVNALPNIRRTITYTNRVPSPPRVNNINRTITYTRRVVGAIPRATGFSGEVSRPTLLMVGEQGRERVSVHPVGAPHMGGTKGGYVGGGGAGGKPAIFRGDVILDGHKVGRVVGRLIAENNV